MNPWHFDDFCQLYDMKKSLNLLHYKLTFTSGYLILQDQFLDIWTQPSDGVGDSAVRELDVEIGQLVGVGIDIDQLHKAEGFSQQVGLTHQVCQAGTKIEWSELQTFLPVMVMI